MRKVSRLDANPPNLFTVFHEMHRSSCHQKAHLQNQKIMLTVASFQNRAYNKSYTIHRIRFIMEGDILRFNQYKTSGQMIQLSNALIWFRNQELQLHDLTSSQFEVIRYLMTHRETPATAGTLMQQLTLSQSTMAGILKRLESKGLIERQPDKNDARREFIVLTEKGAALEEPLKGIVCKTEKILLQGMSEAEQDEFNRLLHIALTNMNSVRCERGNGLNGEQQGIV